MMGKKRVAMTESFLFAACSNLVGAIVPSHKSDCCDQFAKCVSSTYETAWTLKTTQSAFSLMPTPAR